MLLSTVAAPGYIPTKAAFFTLILGYTNQKNASDTNIRCKAHQETRCQLCPLTTSGQGGRMHVSPS